MSRRFNSRSESYELKADLHSIRFWSVFFMFFLFEKVCAFLSAFLSDHFRTKAAFIDHAYIDGNFVQKAIFYNTAVMCHFTKNAFRKLLSNM